MDAQKQLLEEIRKNLATTGLLGVSGAVLYSARETLVKGDIYFLGANPGGDPKDPTADYSSIGETIDESLSCTNPSFNRYISEKWREEGENRIQQGAQQLFKALDLELTKTCCSSVSFVRQRSSRGMRQSEKDSEKQKWQCYAKESWPCHLEILKCVQPRLIIVYNYRASNFVRGKMEALRPDHDFSFELKDGNRFRYYEGTLSEVGQGPVGFLTLPCFSYGWLDDPEDADVQTALGRLKQKMKEHG